MYKKVFSMALLFFATIMLVIPQPGYTGEPLNKNTDNKKFQVQITPPGDGFKVGMNGLTLKISDAKGKAVTGASVSITPWMPGMGHGVMLTPTVKETGKGNYTAGNVGFSMPGQWQLIVTVNKKDISDRATFEFANISGGTPAKTGVACNCGTGGNCPPSCLCGCQAGATSVKCNMKGGKCFGNCSCGCKEGKPCQMKDGKCIGGCGSDCQAGATAAKCNMVDGKCQGNCSCGCKEGKPCKMKNGKCIGGCGSDCQNAGAVDCKCGAGCTKLLNCNCGPDCKCPKDGKGGCGCKVGCATGCGRRPCPLPKPLGT